MRIKLFYILFVLNVFSCRDNSNIISDNNINTKNFSGMWELEYIESYNENTNSWQKDTNYNGWVGHILYDGQGHMGVQILGKGYKDFDTKKNINDLTREELIELVNLYKSNLVYFANYTIKNDTIEHHRITATEPSDWGTTLKRNFAFVGEILYLIPHENTKARLRWKKLK